jgi:hypothetical protein
MFDINDMGDIILVDMTLLNGSTVHMVAVATDNGIPPRQVMYLFYMTTVQNITDYIAGVASMRAWRAAI